MDWIQHAKQLFQMPKPAHFTNYRHCCECAEHDTTLLAYDVDSIGIEQLGHPSWDPLCFTSASGLLYYIPALIRLTLETIDKPQERYIEQFLFHLISGGKDHNLMLACSPEQRACIAGFLEYVIETHGAACDGCAFADDLLMAYEIWSAK